ncbi:MAG: Cell shape-determining protein MreC [Caldanaerobacter subterraneus]|uniref:Cell shape-determining protein MreC n=2 Tax=Thermoanaerobacter TaxID=1754 RepID=B0KAD8_THEP3|nr:MULTISPECIES: rod shape-determining protein MreC [Thermoanaerobacter]KUJ91078.1 MAG: rod shape-determining protein MreC [Thermoanaerobacter thermocopriae]KUK35321.1 MAG: Cell shape-determining protein MreC [Caldanaerobacter subterraneus]ABY93405.1 rod shape-determining protein MreC [Thermoanaerobacter sp. X514]ABY95101.1 rod shape-determining protein MreC [Thermoanaerobacter pseudethanolicus ATCC 33223]ADV80052.1 rod shape-determining protein MreC [Thermoanaerobacter brockii subsp. finnii A
MPRFFRNNKQFILFFLIAVALIAAMAYTYGTERYVTKVESIVGTVFTPIQKVFYQMGEEISNFFSSISEIGTLRATNEKLQKEVEKLRKENIQLQELMNENKRLKEALNFKTENVELDLKLATITGKNSGNWFNIFTIDKGKNEGIKPGMAVLDEKGNMVGQITEVGDNWAKVLAIIDRDSSVSAVAVRTRDNGVVRGDSNGGLIMIYLPLDAELIEGDVVTTSGMSRFPKGLIIGKVSKVTRDPGSLLKQAVIEPAADFERLEYVFVVTNTTNTGK